MHPAHPSHAELMRSLGERSRHIRRILQQYETDLAATAMADPAIRAAGRLALKNALAAAEILAARAEPTQANLPEA